MEVDSEGPSVGNTEGADVDVVAPGVGAGVSKPLCAGVGSGVGPADGLRVGDGAQTSQQPSS